MKPYLFFLAIAYLIGILTTEAQTTCPDKKSLYGLKKAIDSNHVKKDGIKRYRFAYTKFILDAACAANIKDPRLVQKRVAFMWQKFAGEYVSEDSSLRLKDLLRYAINIRYQPLMLAAAKRWHLNLNEVNEEGQSLLQYLESEIQSEQDSNTAKMLQEYYDLYIEQGAVHFQHLSFMTKILSGRFEKIRPFAYGHYAVRKGGKWGFVNHKGVIVIPIQYKAVRHYLEDIFEVSKDGVNFYYVNHNHILVKSPWNKY